MSTDHSERFGHRFSRQSLASIIQVYGANGVQFCSCNFVVNDALLSWGPCP